MKVSTENNAYVIFTTMFEIFNNIKLKTRRTFLYGFTFENTHTSYLNAKGIFMKL